jgi:2-oxoglutarate ferredoxin oxidoreductase subunit alpha
VQEAIDLTVLSFDLAEKYRNLVFILADGSVGQMMEPAELPEMRPVIRKDWDWAVNGKDKRQRRILSSIYINPYEEEIANYRMARTWQTIQKNEVRYKEYFLEDAEFVVVGFGTAGRIALSAVRAARQMGIKVGLLRPVSLSPFPFAVLTELAGRASAFLVVEMNSGQMLTDVQLAVKGRIPVEFYGRPGGVVPFPEEILKEIKRMSSSRTLSVATDPRAAWIERVTAR